MSARHRVQALWSLLWPIMSAGRSRWQVAALFPVLDIELLGYLYDHINFHLVIEGSLEVKHPTDGKLPNRFSLIRNVFVPVPDQ